MSTESLDSTRVTPQDDVASEQVALDEHLKLALDNLRSFMSPIDSLCLIVALLFYKRLSDMWEEEQQQQQQVEVFHADGKNLLQACCRDEHIFDIPTGCLWSDVRRCADDRDKSKMLGTALSASFRSIEYHNPRLQGIFQDVDLLDVHRFPILQLHSLFWHIDRLRLHRAKCNSLALGNACERLRERIEKLVKQRNGFFTPISVAQLMVALSEPREHTTIYDPVCGSAGLLVESARYLERSGRDSQSLHLFGHEYGASTTRISLLLYGISNATLVRGDSSSGAIPAGLAAPWADSELPRRKFDYILSNPPFSTSSWRREQYRYSDVHDGYMFGRPPRGCADFAFLQQMLASLADGGRMAAIMPVGALFRASAAKIRQEMVRSDLLEVIVALGSKLFVSTNVSVALLVFRRGKPSERRGRILFIAGDAQYETDQKKRQLSDEHCRRIIEVFQRFGDEPGFSRVVTLDEIQGDEADLSPTLYVGISHEDAGSHVEPRSKHRSRRATKNLAPASVSNEQHRAARAKLEQLREWRNHSIIKILSGSDDVNRQFTPLGEVPRDWKLVPLSEVLRDRLLNGCKFKTEAFGAGVRVIGQKALDEDGFVDFQQHRRVRLDINKCGHFAILSGDLIVTRVNGSRELCGLTALASEPPELTVCDSSMIRLRPDPAVIDPLLLMYWLNFSYGRRFVVSRISGSVQYFISQRSLSLVPCPVLPDQVRHDISRELGHFHEVVQIAALELARIEKECLAIVRGDALDSVT